MKPANSTKAYLISVGAVMLASIYPIYMGVTVIAAFIRDGQIDASAYPKYIIPYTPVCIAVIIAAALVPLAVKLLKKHALLGLSLLGIGIFLLSETLFEGITVFSQETIAGDVGSWQLYLCIVTPQVLAEYKSTIGDELTARYSPIFKLHFYLIAILIVLAVIGLVYGFYKMYKSEQYARRRPLIMQAVSTIIFIGLCIFACFTAFYRTGDINISALSSWLMSIFFIAFGVTAGSYAGGILFEKGPFLSRWLPAFIAGLTTILMYIGELVLMGGVLFKFGKGFFFEPLGFIPLAPVDILVVLLSVAITYSLLWAIRKQDVSVQK